MAYKIAQKTLPAYSHKYSPKTFTQHQLFACLVLKTFMKMDYREITIFLQDCPDLCGVVNLKRVPHFTTLQKASNKLLRFSVANELLYSTVKTLNPECKIKLAAVDSTGMEAGHISRYFVRRKRAKELEATESTYYRRFPKLSIVCDCDNHLILSAVAPRGPSVDVNQFIKTLKPAVTSYNIDCILADAGYDSEANHRYARDKCKIKSTIPAKSGRPQLTPKPFKGKYREIMRTEFDKETYGQRWQVETVFSMIKRNFGDTIYARKYWAQCRELLLLVLTHNIAVVHLVRAFLQSIPDPFNFS